MKYRLVTTSDQRLKETCNRIFSSYGEPGVMGLRLPVEKFEEEMTSHFGYCPLGVLESGTREYEACRRSGAMLLPEDGGFIHNPDASPPPEPPGIHQRQDQTR